MVLDPARLMAIQPPRRTVVYDDRTTMLYALAAGLGSAGEKRDLPFVYEKALKPLPSFATLFAFDDSWLRDVGIDLAHVVHGSLDLTFHHPLAPTGEVETSFSITGLSDKGAGRGGIVLQDIGVAQRGERACTVLSTLFVRGGGGFGGSTGAEAPAHSAPDRAPDSTAALATALNQAMLFRLLGDRNPLHIDPAVAKAAGFDRPILHGACTFAIACAAVLRAHTGDDPARLTRLAARFAGPLYPGEMLDFSFWHAPEGLAFRAHARERNAIVLDNGFAGLRP